MAEEKNKPRKIRTLADMQVFYRSATKEKPSQIPLRSYSSKMAQQKIMGITEIHEPLYWKWGGVENGTKGFFQSTTIIEAFAKIPDIEKELGKKIKTFQMANASEVEENKK